MNKLTQSPTGFVDSHCHLDRINLSEFDNDLSHLMNMIAQRDVACMLCVGISLESFDSMYQMIQPLHQVVCSVGVHPDEAHCQEPNVAQLVGLSQRPKVVAIGETGLDYHYQSLSPAKQKTRFEIHLQAALEAQKPVIVHSRDARDDTIDALRNAQVAKFGGVLHCFTETWEMAKQALDLGMYISFSGIITFKSAHSLREVARKVPDNRLLIETDSPYLAPVPHRGKTNHPGNVGLVAATLAQVRNCEIEHIKRVSRENFFDLFGDLTS